MTAKEDISSDFPYKSNYIEVHGSRIHYIDEGVGKPILFLHGNPTSSYIWRNVLPHVVPLARCIALDLIGMGKSDKPDLEYRFFDHQKFVEGFIDRMGLKNVTLVLHDWGSALGLHYAMRHEGNVKALAFMEAILLPVPSWDMFHPDHRDIFKGFRSPDVGWDMIVNKNMFVEQILPEATVRKLRDKEMNHYREPFVEPSSRKPVWRWPNELPIEGEPADVVAVVESYNRWLQQTVLPKLLFYGTPGVLITAPVLDWCKQNLRHLKTVDIGPGLHYLPEDNPHLIGSELAHWYKSLP
jgi:haloalkane dehalogenase